MTLDDDLLEVLDRLTTMLRWRDGRSLATTAEVLTDAVGDWIAEHAAEFNRSEPFTSVSTDSDALAAALGNLVRRARIVDKPRSPRTGPVHGIDGSTRSVAVLDAVQRRLGPGC